MKSNIAILAGLVAVAATFDEFKMAINAEHIAEIEAKKIADIEREKARAIEAEAQAKADEETAKRDAKIEAFNPQNISPEMIANLRVTNGMPEWLIMQRYQEWIDQHPNSNG